MELAQQHKPTGFKTFLTHKSKGSRMSLRPENRLQFDALSVTFMPLSGVVVVVSSYFA
jgi:hypothetical protein